MSFSASVGAVMMKLIIVELGEVRWWNAFFMAARWLEEGVNGGDVQGDKVMLVFQ